MGLVVQKFGGTSVNAPEKRAQVLGKIIKVKEKGNDVVVVVSAMGRKGEPYATDTFLDLLQQIGPNPDEKLKDMLISCGEIISVCVLAQALKERGFPAEAMTGFQAGIFTNNNFTNAEITRINPVRIQEKLQQGKIVVVAGFQGCTEEMEITTLGRGGSDTTAIALGGALGAELVEIYTDVPGVAFTDPRLIAQAPYIKSIDFEPMYILARSGAKVIHRQAVKTALNYNRPFVVRSTFDDCEGTLIGKPGENFAGIIGIAVMDDIIFLKVKVQDPAGVWEKIAVDQLFYQVEGDACHLAVQVNPESLAMKSECSVIEKCSLITLVWNPANEAIRRKIEVLLSKNNIQPKGFFALSSGGSWAISEQQSRQALQLLFNLSLAGQELAI